MKTPFERTKEFYYSPKTTGEEFLAEFQGMYGITFTHEEIDEILLNSYKPLTISTRNLNV